MKRRRWSGRALALAALSAALTASSSAPAATPAPAVAQAVAFVAGHPTHIVCDADTNPSPFPTPPGSVATAWTYTGGDTIHAHPAFCDASNAPIGSDSFARAIDVFIHEAARARGVMGDSCPELIADIGVFDVLRRFYGVPFFTPMSRRVGAQVLALTRTLPASYQPELCWEAKPSG